MEAVNISQHLVLGMVPIEDLVGEVLAGARQGIGKADGHRADQVFDCERDRLVAGKDFEEGLDFLDSGNLIESNTDGVVLEPPKIDAPCMGASEDPLP